ncbi:hypothetical protein EGW08_019432 [Elysia chlorotica]|uniref:Centrosomal protein of 44 kDa n=1 Tax=Elysia chlorotica TaxID=188477 RepID=A0A3S1B5W5_ELYCH|nr:hypothetical protein EGW08_019432 [Elysia chlorotica]
MATGDLKNNLKQLMNELKTVKYGKGLDTNQIVSGSPQAYLPIYNYLFTTYSAKFNADIVNSNNELYGKSDMRFMEAVYKILRDMFDYKAKITRDQFFAPGFSEHKIIMAMEVVRLVRSRYSPPKSARPHSAGVRSGTGALETAEIQQKVPDKKTISSSLAAGAIVLPTRGASSGYKIPKTRSGPGPKHNQERPVFGEARLTAPPSLSSSGAAHIRNEVHDQPGSAKSREPRVIRANVNPAMDCFNPLPMLHNGLPQAEAASAATPHVLNAEEIEAIVRRKVVDLVSPAMVKMNEQIGALKITVEDLEEKEKEPVRSEPAPSAALIGGLTQQMNDVVFKLQTLTSRITLLENRVTMVESQLNDEELYRRTLFASQSYTNSKNSRQGATQQMAEMVQRMPLKSPASQYENSDKPSGKVTRSEKAQAHKSNKNGSGLHDVITLNGHDRNVEAGGDAKSTKSSSVGHKVPGMSSVNGEGHAFDLEPDPVVPDKSPALAFMKSLVPPEDCNSLLTTSGAEPPDDLNTTENTTQQQEDEVSNAVPPAPSPPSGATMGRDNTNRQNPSSSAQLQDMDSLPPAHPKQSRQSKKTKPGKPVATKTGGPFSEAFSPIRPFSELGFTGDEEDESPSLVFDCAGYVADDSSLADRRSSTPTGQGAGLDTSTLDRISRISQLMAATEKMLN